MTRRIAVVSGGTSVPSSTRLLADRLAEATAARLRGSGEDVLVDVIELRPLARPLADAVLTGFPSGDLAAAVEKVRRADALVVVTPVFQASYSGLFKLFFDVLEPGLLEGQPVLLGATAGTARHSLVLEHAMRPLFAHLKAIVVPTAVFAASGDFGDTTDGRLTERIDRAGGELAALVAGRPATAPAARPEALAGSGLGLEESVPFEELLRQVGQAP
jgi:FMN reductase